MTCKISIRFILSFIYSNIFTNIRSGVKISVYSLWYLLRKGSIFLNNNISHNMRNMSGIFFWKTKNRSTWPDNVTVSHCSFFEEKWPNHASWPKSAPNRDSFWAYRLFNVCIRVLCASGDGGVSILPVCSFRTHPVNSTMIFEVISQYFSPLSSVYISTFVQRNYENYYISIQTKAYCYQLRNNH